ncbi:MAG: hypothetical protein IJH37_05310 [Clostridia bacterium]|nr:hypothetical protein [Clostridia bacterium]
MSIHIGAEGVVRQLKGLAFGHRLGVYETFIVKCGINGVVRNLIDISDIIDHAEVSVNTISVNTVNSDGEDISKDGDDLTTLNRYGSISFGTNNVQLTCTTAKKRLFIRYTIYVVFKDGLKAYLDDIISTGGVTYTLSVTGYEYFSNSGWYQNVCLDNEVITGYVSSSRTESAILTDVKNQTDGYISSALEYSGTCTSRQTFNSITVNGTSFPVTVVNNLT